MRPVLESVELPSDAVEVGSIVDAWGIKGWLRIQPHSAFPEALFSSRRWFLQPSERGGRAFDGTVCLSIKEARAHSGAVVAAAQEIADRDAAQALKGARVFVPRSEFPVVGPDEYYWVDLLGLDVVNREGVALGKVRDLLSTGPQTVLVIKQSPLVEAGAKEKVRERMIPFVAAFVDKVDLAGRRIVVDWQPDY